MSAPLNNRPILGIYHRIEQPADERVKGRVSYTAYKAVLESVENPLWMTLIEQLKDGMRRR